MHRAMGLGLVTAVVLSGLVAPGSSWAAGAVPEANARAVDAASTEACAGRSFTSSGDFTCSVPAGQTVRWTAKGGNGGKGSSLGSVSQEALGGLGAKVSGSYTNNSDEAVVLYLHVGQDSSASTNFLGQGGGFTSISSTDSWLPEDALVIAAGGGAMGSGGARGGNGFGGAVSTSAGWGGAGGKPGLDGGVTATTAGVSGGFGGAGYFFGGSEYAAFLSGQAGGLGGWPGFLGLVSRVGGDGGDGFRSGAGGGSGGTYVSSGGAGGGGLAGGGGAGADLRFLSNTLTYVTGGGGGGLSLVREGATLITDTSVAEHSFIAFAEHVSPACDATLAASIPAGSGSASDPYLIYSNANLAWLRANPSAWGSSFRMTADIEANICEVTSGIGNSTTPFTGTFDGAGHVISGLTISSSDGQNIGLFGVTRGATVKSLALENASISGASLVGGLIGSAIRTTLRSSSVTGSVTASSVQAGGLVGSMDAGSIENSYSRAAVTAWRFAGGLVGLAFNGTSIDASYAASDSAPTVTSNASGSASALVASGKPRLQDVFWNSTTMSAARSSSGTSATSTQMRKQSTFASAAWNITDGWSLVTPWSICSSVNDGFPFLSARFSNTPCPTLTASPPQAVLTRGKTMTPVVMSARGFTPTKFDITNGSLPAGLSLDKTTGAISGKPTAVSKDVSVTITATNGDVSASTQATIRVREAARSVISTDVLKGACARELNGETLTITCADPGNYNIVIPSGGVVTELAVTGADGGAPAGLFFDTVTANPRSWNIGGSNWGGVGATVGVTQSQLPALDPGSTSLGVVVGAHGTGSNKSVSGGGYSSVSAVREGLGSGALIAAAGGGGGGSLLNASQMNGCAPIVMAESHDQPRSEASKAKLANCMSANVGLSSAGWALSSNEQVDLWARIASGQSGWWDKPVLSVGWASMTYGPVITGGLGGFSYGPEGATVAPNFTDITGPAAPRNGRVVITIHLANAGAPAACSPAVPELGQTVVCDTAGLARVPVPAGALLARVNVAGAGGGAPAGSANSTSSPLIDGGSGGLVNAWIPVSTLSAVDVNVGAGGAASTYTQSDGSTLFGYGLGGGASTLSAPNGDLIIAAGGGGGANGYSGSGLTATQAAELQSALTGATATTPTMTLAPTASAGVGGSAATQFPGGAQGASGWTSALVSSAELDVAGGSYGGQAQTRNPAGSTGSVLLRFCGLPSAPIVTSVTPGNTSGQPTADVTATAASDGGCGPLTYEFRISDDAPWTSAPGLNFPIIYNLTSGQSVCVQMRAQNEAGFGPASSYACGTARNTSADAGRSTGGGVDGTTITFSAAGSATPTVITVGTGGTFYIINQGLTADGAYVRDNGGDIRSAGAACTSSTVSVCYLTQGVNGPYTVDATGGIYLYNPVRTSGTAVTIN